MKKFAKRIPFRSCIAFIFIIPLLLYLHLWIDLTPALPTSLVIDETPTTPVVRTHYVHPPILYGHVHMAKTGGTSINGMFANRFERICGHKGYSYDAFGSNERAKKKIKKKEYNRDRVHRDTMNEIGYENCDYLSNEVGWEWWVENFGNRTFHGIPMELHVPCRDPIDHLMSQCNFKRIMLKCDAATDEEFFRSINTCFVLILARYNDRLRKHFDVKCYDFQKQFTTYQDYMFERLQPRRLVSTPFVKRETNRQRNMTSECIWGRPDLLEKATNYLLKQSYYQFCNACVGSEDDITK
eukprot:scaffold371961_cov63-Attheya_sp.AAC.1